MIGRALNVKERLVAYCFRNSKDKQLKENTLTEDDWRQLDTLHDTLHAFEISTMDTQGKAKHLYDWYPTLHWLLDTMDGYTEDYKEQAESDDSYTVLSACCEASWHKVEKYFKKVDETPIYYAAVMLNPLLKAGWFSDRWSEGTPEQQQWILDVRAAVTNIWQSDYKPTTTPATSTSQKSTDDDANLRTSLSAYKRRKVDSTGQTALQTDPLELYLATACEVDPHDNLPLQGKAQTPPFDVLQHWYERRHTQPELAKFAFDTLAIPLMSDAPERAFSAGRDLIHYRRSNLNDTIIEACSCLRNWLGKKTAAFDDDSEVEVAYNQARASIVEERSEDSYQHSD